MLHTLQTAMFVLLLLPSIRSDDSKAHQTCTALPSAESVAVKWSPSTQTCLFAMVDVVNFPQINCTKMLRPGYDDKYKAFHSPTLAIINENTTLPTLKRWEDNQEIFKLTWVSAHVQIDKQPPNAQCTTHDFVWPDNTTIDPNLWASPKHSLWKNGCCAALDVKQKRLVMLDCNGGLTSSLCQLTAKGCVPTNSPDLMTYGIKTKKLKTFYYPNDTVSVQCKTGYSVDGTNGTVTKQEIRCTTNETWETKNLIQCVPNKEHKESTTITPAKSSNWRIIVPVGLSLTVLAAALLVAVGCTVAQKQKAKHQKTEDQSLKTAVDISVVKDSGSNRGSGTKSAPASPNLMSVTASESTVLDQSLTVGTGPTKTELQLSTSGRSCGTKS